MRFATRVLRTTMAITVVNLLVAVPAAFVVDRDGEARQPPAAAAPPAVAATSTTAPATTALPTADRTVPRKGVAPPRATATDGTTASPRTTPAAGTDGRPGSPSGTPSGRIVFSAWGVDEDTAVYAVNADGTDLVRVTRGAAPRWSPDGSLIAFLDEDDHPRGVLHVVKADGTGRRALTRSDVNAGAFAWSPGGDHIAFTTTRATAKPAFYYGPPFVGVAGFESDISVVSLDSLASQPVTVDPGVETMPTWSPDGTRIAFLRFQLDRYRVDSVAVDGSSPREHTPRTTTDYVTGVAWSPAGPWIAFSRNGSTSARHEVWLTRSDHDDARQLRSVDSELFAPRWSRDGRMVAFHEARTDAEQHERAHVVTADGATAYTFHGRNPTFSPDGAYVVYCHDTGLWRANVDGSNAVRLFPGLCDAADWQPTDV